MTYSYKDGETTYSGDFNPFSCAVITTVKDSETKEISVQWHDIEKIEALKDLCDTILTDFRANRRAK